MQRLCLSASMIETSSSPYPYNPYTNWPISLSVRWMSDCKCFFSTYFWKRLMGR